MAKKNLYIDVDGTIWDSVSAICKIYNDDYVFHDEFIPAVSYLVNRWDMSDECPLCDNIKSYFEDDRFFENVNYMPNANGVLNILSQNYNINLVTVGTTTNLVKKYEWFKDEPWLDKFIGVDIKNDKSKVDMRNGIMIDDNSKYLRSCNAPVKIIFGEVHEWNQDWNEKTEGIRCYNWFDILRYLM